MSARVARMLLATLPLVVAAGCASYERGRLPIASVRSVEAPFQIVKNEAEGTSCASMFEARYEQAVRDALARAPGANALVAASWYFEKLCITVRGTAVYFPQPIDVPRDLPVEETPNEPPEDAPTGDDHAPPAG